jgi:DNA-binding response OmpR family regulator
VEIQSRVLIVEDDAPLRRSLEKYLGRAGYAFDSCSTAREAKILAERFRHPIVISEYHLPDANGASFLEDLKRIVPRNVAIMISQYDLQAISRDLDRIQVRCYLKKPFDLVDFEAALTAANVLTMPTPAGEGIELSSELS